jgi:2-polyprenyl-6-methoxyphenol hydroxylase-like FAD-dependent oxidoreductase
MCHILWHIHESPSVINNYIRYLIPGASGTLKPGNRLMNFVWYTNYPENSTELKNLMTDTSSHLHHNTLPPSAMRPAIWASQQKFAEETLPPQFAELVSKTEKPFVQKITDVKSPECVFMDGKVVCVGDAVVGLRPHTAASTSQAALHALRLFDVFKEWEEAAGKEKLPRFEMWREESLNWAGEMAKRGRDMGNRSQFGSHPLAS